MLHALIRGANGRRHEVDFGDAPIRVQIYASDETIEIFVEADFETMPAGASALLTARETLTRLCASPVIGVLESKWDCRSSAMEARILRRLWFGLLEARSREESATEWVGRRLYRKAPLFDRFVKFNVQVESPDIRH